MGNGMLTQHLSRKEIYPTSEYEPQSYQERVDFATHDAMDAARLGIDTLAHGEFAAFVSHSHGASPLLFVNIIEPMIARCLKYENSIDFYVTIKYKNMSRETFELIKPYINRFHKLLQTIRQAKNPARNGYIYIAEAMFAKPVYKIGMSKTPDARVEKINGYLPVTVRMKHKIKTDDMILVEQLLHQQFAEHALQNEWFNPPQNELDALLEIDSLFLYEGKS